MVLRQSLVEFRAIRLSELWPRAIVIGLVVLLFRSAVFQSAMPEGDDAVGQFLGGFWRGLGLSCMFSSWSGVDPYSGNFAFPSVYSILLGALNMLFGPSLALGLLWMCVLVVGFEGMYRFTRRFVGFVPSLLASCLFLFNPLVAAQIFSGELPIIVVYSAIPWVLLSLERLAEKPNAKSLAGLSMLLIALVPSGNLPLLFIAFIAFAVYGLFLAAKQLRHKVRMGFSTLLWFGGVSMSVIVGLVPYLYFMRMFSPFYLAPAFSRSLWAYQHHSATTTLEQLTGMADYSYFYLHLPGVGMFYSVASSSLLLIAFCFGSLVFGSKRKTPTLYFSLIAVAFVVLTGGSHSLASTPLEWLYLNTPFNYLSTSGRWPLLSYVCYSVLLAFGLDGLRKSGVALKHYLGNVKLNLQALLVVVLVGLIVSSTLPMFSWGYTGYTPPSSWANVIDVIKSDPEYPNFYTYVIPSSDWTLVTPKPEPSHVGSLNYLIAYLTLNGIRATTLSPWRNLLNQMELSSGTKYVGKLLSMAGVKYVAIFGDLYAPPNALVTTEVERAFFARQEGFKTMYDDGEHVLLRNDFFVGNYPVAGTSELWIVFGGPSAVINLLSLPTFGPQGVILEGEKLGSRGSLKFVLDWNSTVNLALPDGASSIQDLVVALADKDVYYLSRYADSKVLNASISWIAAPSLSARWGVFADSPAFTQARASLRLNVNVDSTEQYYVFLRVLPMGSFHLNLKFGEDHTERILQTQALGYPLWATMGPLNLRKGTYSVEIENIDATWVSLDSLILLERKAYDEAESKTKILLRQANVAYVPSSVFKEAMSLSMSPSVGLTAGYQLAAVTQDSWPISAVVRFKNSTLNVQLARQEVAGQISPAFELQEGLTNIMVSSTAFSPAWDIENGSMVHIGYGSTYLPFDFADGTVTSILRFINATSPDSSAGVIILKDGDQGKDQYELRLYPEKIALQERVAGEVISVSTFELERKLSIGKWYNLTVAAMGSDFWVSIDGDPIAKFNIGHSRVPGGYLGIIQFGEKTIAHYRAFHVKDPTGSPRLVLDFNRYSPAKIEAIALLKTPRRVLSVPYPEPLQFERLAPYHFALDIPVEQNLSAVVLRESYNSGWKLQLPTGRWEAIPAYNGLFNIFVMADNHSHNGRGDLIFILQDFVAWYYLFLGMITIAFLSLALSSRFPQNGGKRLKVLGCCHTPVRQ